MPYEILVHISAPTTKERDDLYRDEALAYQNFRPSKRLFLDERDGDNAASKFRHPRHRALREEEPQVTQETRLRTFGLESFNVTDPGSSNQSYRHYDTQVILDTQKAIGALESQISIITNSSYDGTTLSLTGYRPTKRPRTAESVLNSLSSKRGDLPAPNSSPPFRSPLASTHFYGADPISSLLPESYGLSRSGGSDSTQSPEKLNNGTDVSAVSATPLRLRHDFGTAYYTPEDKDAAALLLGSPTGGSPAVFNMSNMNLPSRADSPTAVESRELSRNRLSTPAQQASHLSRQQTLDASPRIEPSSMDCSDGGTTSPSSSHAPISISGLRLVLTDACSTSQRGGMRASRAVGSLPSSSPRFSVRDTRDNGVQTNPGTDCFYASEIWERCSSYELRGHEIAADQTSSGRSSISVGHDRKINDENNQTVADRTSTSSPFEGDGFIFRTSSSQVPVWEHVKPKTRENRTNQSQQSDKTGTCLSPCTQTNSSPRKFAAIDCNKTSAMTLNNPVTAPAPEFAAAPSASTAPVRTLDKRTEKLLQDINGLPLEVFSPKAPVGLDGPVTFVTPIIASFFAKAELRKRWARNATIDRPISKFEIGHWAIETKSWSHRLQLSFWKVLANQIGLRQAGISTWCKRIPEPDQLGTIKVYCWGEIVEHLFLFLFTIADTGISSQEACWLDGQNEVVVRVRPRQSSR